MSTNKYEYRMRADVTCVHAGWSAMSSVYSAELNKSNCKLFDFILLFEALHELCYLK